MRNLFGLLWSYLFLFDSTMLHLAFSLSFTVSDRCPTHQEFSTEKGGNDVWHICSYTTILHFLHLAAVADTILKELFFCVRCVSIFCLVSVFEWKGSRRVIEDVSRTMLQRNWMLELPNNIWSAIWNPWKKSAHQIPTGQQWNVTLELNHVAFMWLS